MFNGLYRVNGKGLFNVPKGDYKNPKILDSDNILDFSKSLPEVGNIHFEDFRECKKRIEKGDLVYFDPPCHPLVKPLHLHSIQVYLVKMNK